MLDHRRDVASAPLLSRVPLGLRVVALSLGGTVAEEVFDAFMLAEDVCPHSASEVPVTFHLGRRERHEHGACRRYSSWRIRNCTALLERWR